MNDSTRRPKHDLERLLSRVDAMHRRRDAAVDAPDEVSAPVHDQDWTDFRTLPGYDELRMQRAVAANYGLSNPYFKLHDGLASAYTEIDGRRLLNFSCYDYLGLNGHPDIVQAAKAAIDRYGISCSASRHVAGERSVHLQLERSLANHYASDDALIFVSGYATNLSVIGQLMGSKDLIVCDAAVHNSAVMGSVLSGAARRTFPHNDLDALDQLLASVRTRFERVLILVEGLYSMDGDVPDLRRLTEIKRRHGAWLMVDEAHSLGTLGARGGGLAEHFSIDPSEVDIWMGTLSKALVGCGGYIAGSAALIDYLRCMAGAFVYSVGMAPVLAAAADKALEMLHREPQRVAKLQRNSRHFLDFARRKGLDVGRGCGVAICPIIVGDSIAAVALSQKLFSKGINVQPVLYPAVPAKSAILRFFVTALHAEEEIEAAISTLVGELGRVGKASAA